MSPIHSNRHYPVLDGLRGLAILMVVTWNFASELHVEPGSIVAKLRALCRLNWSGVDLFFVLSGFLIGGILLDNRNAANCLKIFYLRRTARIFPIYYLVLLLCTLAILTLDTSNPGMLWLLSDQGVGGKGLGDINHIPLWSYWLYLQNIWMALTTTWGPGCLGMTWSLAVEEQFYLLLPFIVLFVPPSRLWMVLALCFVAAPLFRLTRESWLGAFALLPARADSLVAGVFGALLLRSRTVYAWLTTHFTLLLAGQLVLLAVFAALLRRPEMMGNFHHSFLACFYAAVLVSALVFPTRLLGPVFQWSWLRFIGRISYGIYLFHGSVIAIVHLLLFKDAPHVRNAAEASATLGALVLTVLIAYTSFHLFEKRFTTWARRFNYEYGDLPRPVVAIAK